jgi:predicted metalloprotease with PDZ domain
MKNAPIRYTLCPANPEAHLYEVTCRVEFPDPAGQRFALPAWIPGSYLIRDFARQIVSHLGRSRRQGHCLHKIDKHTWQAEALKGKQALTLTYQVYAWDLSVRGAHLDQTHAFFNGTSVFLRVLGQEESPCLVDLKPPKGKAYAGWRVATALAPAHTGEDGRQASWLRPLRCHQLRRTDRPPGRDGRIHAGHFRGLRRAARSRHHRPPRLRPGAPDADLKKICEWQIRFFGEPAPMKRYVFLVTAVGDGYGGLEHRASTALLCSRNDLPYAGMKGLPEATAPSSACAATSTSTPGTSSASSRRPSPPTTSSARTTRRCCGPSRASPPTTTISPWCAAASSSEKDWLELLGQDHRNVLRGPAG